MFAFLLGLAATADGLATEFSALAVGAPLADRVLQLGKFQFQLPEGQWVAAAQREVRGGTQSGTSATPSILNAAVARVEGNQVTAVLNVRVPASTFAGATRWSDDPCKGVENAVVKDTMNQTFAMPECFTLFRYRGPAMAQATEGIYGDVAKWIGSAGATMPPRMMRVYYIKYSGGDFVNVIAHVPLKSEDHAAVEAWGRQLAAQMAAMVTGKSSAAVVPATP